MWEGWGLYVDKSVQIRAGDRKGAFVRSGVDGDVEQQGKDGDEERRKREIEELLLEDEDVSDEADENNDRMED